MNKIAFFITVALVLFVSAAISQKYSSADFPHPSFGMIELSPEKLSEIKQSTKIEKDMSETDLVNLIEDNSMAFWISCPNCEGGFQGGLLQWKSTDPYKVYCGYCGLTYPNQKYPENKVQKIPDDTGNIQNLYYYEDLQDKQRYYFSAKVRDARFIHLLGVVYNFARIYAASHEIQYARKAVLLLDRMAEVYPRLLPHAGLPYDGGPSRFTDLALPHEYYSGKIWDWWYAEIPWQCAEAYDIVYPSGELEKLSRELGVDVKKRIENDLLRKSVEFVLEFSSILSNAEINTMTSMVAVGRAIGEPSYIHEAIQRAKELLEWHFFRDGIWMEFSGYHFGVVEQYLRLIRSIQGYSDPPGYTDPVYGTHFSNFDPEKEFSQLTLAKSSIYSIYLPDGFMPSTGDTKYNDRNWFQPSSNEPDPSGSVMIGPTLQEYLSPLTSSSSGILPGTGYSWLGMGSGRNQIQAGLNFCESAGHVHYDGLNLSIFAFGHQLLPDLGYTHTRMRWWSWGTLAHNTVKVDGLMQMGGESIETGGDLLLFDVNDPDVHTVEAGNERRYNTKENQLVDLYRRQLIMWDFGGPNPILIDVFRVRGGKRHEWLTHGPVYEDFTASLSIPLKPRPGTLLGEDKTYEQAVAFLDTDGRYNAERAQALAGDKNPRYGFIHDLQYATSNQSWKLSFLPKKNKSGTFLDLHMCSYDNHELFLGKAPAVVPAKENDENAAIPQMPMLVVRRESDKTLTSIFPAVWEAHVGDPLIKDIKPIYIENGNNLDAGLEISLKSDNRKLIMVSLFNSKSSVPEIRKIYLAGQNSKWLEFSGDLMLATLDNLNIQEIYVWNCNSLSYAQDALNFQGRGIYSGELHKILRKQNKFILGSNQKLPENVRQGSCILVELPDGKQEGFIVDKWEQRADNPFRAVVTLQGDPGLDGNARAGTLQRMTYPRKVFPPLTYTGIKWQLPNHDHFKRDKNGLLRMILQ